MYITNKAFSHPLSNKINLFDLVVLWIHAKVEKTCTEIKRKMHIAEV
jgi:hypothetical protein